MNTPTYPNIHVPLIGEEGNVFSILARVRKALRRAGEREAADAFITEAISQPSYEDVLALVQRTVNTDSQDA